jgi:rare lipoprotein A
MQRGIFLFRNYFAGLMVNNTEAGLESIMARFCCAAAALLILIIFVHISFSEHASAESGGASWYALTSQTASGERSDPGALTAAHRSLPFGTKVKVENLKNGKVVVVRINDRGPFHGGRIIDLTKAAAAVLDLMEDGTVQVQLTVLSSER